MGQCHVLRLTKTGQSGHQESIAMSYQKEQISISAHQ